MSCYECKWGPQPCEKWNVEGHTMLCQESKPYVIPEKSDYKPVIDLFSIGKTFEEEWNNYIKEGKL